MFIAAYSEQSKGSNNPKVQQLMKKLNVASYVQNII